MGHRTYLLIQAEGQVEQLFEANNMLPVFWLALLSQPDLQAVAPQWHFLARLEQEGPAEELERFADQWPSPTNVVLSRGAVVANSARAARVLQQQHPELVALHHEFTQYLLAHLPHETDQVRLDMVALTAFSSTAECLQSLHNELEALAQGELSALHPARDQVALTGFPNGPVPAADYPILSHLLAVANQPLAVQAGKVPGSPRRNTASQLFALLASAVLLVASYRGFRQDGLTGMVVPVFLFGVAVLVGSVVGLLSRRSHELSIACCQFYF